MFSPLEHSLHAALECSACPLQPEVTSAAVSLHAGALFRKAFLFDVKSLKTALSGFSLLVGSSTRRGPANGFAKAEKRAKPGRFDQDRFRLRTTSMPAVTTTCCASAISSQATFCICHVLNCNPVLCYRKVRPSPSSSTNKQAA